MSDALESSKIAAAYVRLSTDDKEQKSIPRQINECQAAAAQCGYVVPETNVFTDDGYSGGLLWRPALGRLMDTARSGSIRAVFVSDRDRLSREPAHGWMLREEMQKFGVQYYVGSYAIGDSPEEEIMSGMLDLFGKYERTKIIDRSRRGKEDRARRGHPMVGASVPLGYRYIPNCPDQPGHLVRDPDEAALVERIFHLCVDEGLGIYRIAKRLTAEGIYTKTDRRLLSLQAQRTSSGEADKPLPKINRKKHAIGVWSPSAVQRILRNSSYRGTLYFNKRQTCEPDEKKRRNPINPKRPKSSAKWRNREHWISVPIPFIIPEDLWQAAQQQLDRNADLKNNLNPRRRVHDYLFVNGRARCGWCGRAISGFMSRGKRFYRCSSQSDTVTTICRGRMSADQFEEEIWSVMYENVLREPAYLKLFLEECELRTSKAQEQLQREYALLTEQLEKYDRESQQWERAYADEVISLDRFKALMVDLSLRKTSALKTLEEIKSRIDRRNAEQNQTAHAVTFLETLEAQDNPRSIAARRQIFESIHLMVVYRGPEQARVFFSLPADEYFADEELDEFRWKGPETWKSIDWDEDIAAAVNRPLIASSATTTPISGT
jgi:site-specific DNA recombinase